MRTGTRVGLTALALTVALGSCGISPSERTFEICDNRVDDDGDGKIDCEDLDCKNHPPECMAEVCNNNLDDDHDGQFDCADPDCFADPMCGHSSCGNAMIDPGEECDGDDLGGKTCVSQGFVGGALSCRSCALDVSACTTQQVENCVNGIDDDHDGKIDCADGDCANHPHCRCGNDMIDMGEDGMEECDGTELGGQTCESLGFPGGTLSCKPDCTFDKSQCTPPVCGDGIVSGDEQCDDGNTLPGDGCDPTCHVDVTELCQHAPALALGANFGDTTSGSAFFTASCYPFDGRERVYGFTPAQSGTLALVLTSSTDLGLYVRAACADDASELACANTSPGGASESLSFPVQAGVPLTVFVDGGVDFGGDPGPFTLSLFLTP